jgi:hypothetical protein
MEDKQKVYIRGSKERGDEVIKILENLGGCNSYHLDGHNSNNYYFIAPDGKIHNTTYTVSSIFSFVKEFYKEIDLPRWKPEYAKRFFYINPTGIVGVNVWYGTNVNESYYEFGNCFKTFEEAEAARDKIKEILNQ